MAEGRRYPPGIQQDIQQILIEAQHRWLRPVEICEILRNYNNFQIAPEPPHLPSSGSLFLFDRKVLRYFRKDGHNWRKKKDGKTVKEAHERLKSGSVDVLHCYYAHGEDNENFQRRSYWMLEEELSHIVLVHYREVKGSRTNFNRSTEREETIPISQETEDAIPASEMDTSVSSNFRPNSYQAPAQTTDTASMSTAQAAECEDAESEYNHQASSIFHSFLELQQTGINKIERSMVDPYGPMSFPVKTDDNRGKSSAPAGMNFISLAQAGEAQDNCTGAGLAYEAQKHVNLPSWENLLENCTPVNQTVPFKPPSSSETDALGIDPKQEGEILGQLFSNPLLKGQEEVGHLSNQEAWKTFEVGSSHLSKLAVEQKLDPDLTYDLTTRFHDQELGSGGLVNSLEPFHAQETEHTRCDNLHIDLRNGEHSMILEENSKFCSAVKRHMLNGSVTEELKKLDSFNRWMSRELGDVNEPQSQSNSGAYWDTVGSDNEVDNANIPSQAQLDTYILGPSLAQDQLFSITDFSPNWVYVGSESKILITGRFLKSWEEAESCKWSCMFGEVEVPAEVIADGVLCCCAPFHNAGRVPFCVTLSNRVACSEVREFEYITCSTQGVKISDKYINNTVEELCMRFTNLLCLSSISSSKYDPNSADEISQLNGKLSLLLKDSTNEWDEMLKPSLEEGFSLDKVKDQILQKLLKEKLHVWLLQKVAEGGKGPSVLDKGGQGVLHFAAALGYDWALEPTIVAGVNVNFRDVNGWTALHWAASCGRERTVASLINLSAVPGALTDPTPKYPTGRTPADLASMNGNKGIAAYLAELALTKQLSSLDLDNQHGDAAEVSDIRLVESASEHSATRISEGSLPYGESMKDPLAAVCKATQAAARIHQVFRVQSFQRKQLKEFSDNKYRMSDERALSLIAVKANKSGQHDKPVHAAATRIQNKFRSWKGRREFLIIREQIVKIQAHVRGHQVRKNYKKIVWSVGIVEKVILRWRRKGSGLRGFKSEALTEGPSKQDTLVKEDDYDFFKESRKQTEERSQIALARVKSMLRHPEARDQYCRLQNVVTEIQETKTLQERASNLGSTSEFDDLIDLDVPLDDSTFTPGAL